MIAFALNQIADQLNQFLVEKYQLDEQPVVVADGSDATAIAHKVTITLVNVAAEPHRRRPPPPEMHPAAGKPQTLDLQLSVLVAAHFSGSAYPFSLRLIADIVAFFETRAMFAGPDPEGADKARSSVRVQLTATGIEEMHNIHRALGWTYRPSILCQAHVFR